MKGGQIELQMAAAAAALTPRRWNGGMNLLEALRRGLAMSRG